MLKNSQESLVWGKQQAKGRLHSASGSRWTAFRGRVNGISGRDVTPNAKAAKRPKDRVGYSKKLTMGKKSG